jgi:peptide/nickel transport system permease protein
MLRLILRRLLLFVPKRVAISIVVFVVVHATPGDPAAAFLGHDAAGEGIELTRRRLGLDQPYAMQLLAWVAGAMRAILARASSSVAAWPRRLASACR